MATRLSELTGAAAGVVVICVAAAAGIPAGLMASAHGSTSAFINRVVTQETAITSAPVPARYDPAQKIDADAAALPSSPHLHLTPNLRLDASSTSRLPAIAQAPAAPTLTYETTPPPRLPSGPPARTASPAPPAAPAEAPGISASDRAPTAPAPIASGSAGTPALSEPPKTSTRRVDAIVPPIQRMRPAPIKTSPAVAPAPRVLSTSTKAAARRPPTKVAGATGPKAGATTPPTSPVPAKK